MRPPYGRTPALTRSTATVRLLRPALLLTVLVLALGAAGCGSSEDDVPEVPGAPVELSVPHQKGAADLSEDASATPTPSSTAEGTPTPTPAADTGTTGSTGTTGGTGTNTAATPGAGHGGLADDRHRPARGLRAREVRAVLPGERRGLLRQAALLKRPAARAQFFGAFGGFGVVISVAL